jgi:Protein of unknown function (DUF1566)
MKKLKLFFAMFVILFFSSQTFAQGVGINSTGADPKTSALLDLDASNKGLLIPRVSLTSTASNAPIGDGIETSLLVYNTATISDVTPGYYYWNGTSWIRVATGGFTHYVGELYGGGIVVAVWQVAGIEKGLIASLADISASATWSNITSTLIGITAQSPTNGQANTNAILGQGGHTSSAAKLCNDYTNTNTGTGIYSDWYLPAAWELNQCYNAAYVVNTILGGTNGFQFAVNYWSSTEDSNTNAWYQNFLDGYTHTNGKGNPWSVRAVRMF